MSPQRAHFIRLDLPPDATPEEIEGLEQAVVELGEKYSDLYDYDIAVSGGAWYASDDEEPTPMNVALGTIRRLIQHRTVDNSSTDVAVLRDALQAVADLGMPQINLLEFLAREQATNAVVLRNMEAEQNIRRARAMVTSEDHYYRITFYGQGGKA